MEQMSFIYHSKGLKYAVKIRKTLKKQYNNKYDLLDLFPFTVFKYQS